MKNNVRKKIALGITAAAMMSQTAVFADTKTEDMQMQDMQMSSQQMSFQDRLTGDAVEAFILMDKSQREMAISIADHGCKGKNGCKGQGGCKSDTNSCKGQNACKGQGSCKVSANDAVMMAKKRQAA